MKEERKESGAFTRASTYRSLRGLTGLGVRKVDEMEIPPVSRITVTQNKKGNLWKLSGRRILSRSDWKRKYFVLCQEQGRIYYYENEWGQGGREGEKEKGCGIIELKYFVDCVEAPLTDHKKATNVFLLLAAERGFFDQGRCYLSAETLSEMKDWVSKIKMALNHVHKRSDSRPKVDLPSSSLHSQHPDRVLSQEPVYSSIKEESIHRSNSMSTLPSLYAAREQELDIGKRGRGSKHAKDLHNRSMEVEGPVCGLSGVNHSLTYSYSSSEDSLNESFNISFTRNAPRSAEASLRRPQKSRAEITLPFRSPGLDTSSFGRNDVRHSSPIKSKSSNDSIAKIYSKIDKVDQQLMMTKSITEIDGCVMSGSNTPTMSGTNLSIHQMEDKIRQVSKQSTELYRMFRILERQSTTTSSDVGHLQDSLVSTSESTQNLWDKIEMFNSTMQGLEKHATDLMMEVRSTHSRVVHSLQEAERARKEFIHLKEKAETVLIQLQGDISRSNTKSAHMIREHPSKSQRSSRGSLNVMDESWMKTWSPGQKEKNISFQNDMQQKMEEPPIYSQPTRKSERNERKRDRRDDIFIKSAADQRDSL